MDTSWVGMLSGVVALVFIAPYLLSLYLIGSDRRIGLAVDV